jgi:hypothetical protein
VTKEIGQFLSRITLDRCFVRTECPKFKLFALVRPNKDILRAQPLPSNLIGNDERVSRHPSLGDLLGFTFISINNCYVFATKGTLPIAAIPPHKSIDPSLTVIRLLGHSELFVALQQGLRSGHGHEACGRPSGHYGSHIRVRHNSEFGRSSPIK